MNKLVDTNAVVDKMKKELTALRRCSRRRPRTRQKLLEEVAVDQAQADEVKVRVSKEEAEVGEIAKEAQAIAADAQRDLDEAMPAYYSAVEALKSLNKKDIHGGQGVQAAAGARDDGDGRGLHLLMGRSPTGATAKKLHVGHRTSSSSSPNYDKDNIPEKKIKGIQKYMKMDKFMPDTVGKVSTACGRSACGCARWTRTRASPRRSSRRSRS